MTAPKSKPLPPPPSLTILPVTDWLEVPGCIGDALAEHGPFVAAIYLQGDETVLAHSGKLFGCDEPDTALVRALTVLFPVVALDSRVIKTDLKKLKRSAVENNCSVYVFSEKEVSRKQPN